MALQEFDLVSREFNQDPFPTFARMRGCGPLVQTRLPLLGKVWLTTTYDAAKEVLRDDKTFVRDPGNAGTTRLAGLPWWLPRIVGAFAENMLGKDEPDHRRLRTLVEDAFLRRSVDTMRPRIVTLADHALDNWQRAAAAGNNSSADFVAHFARPFPLAVICELLGLPEQDRPKFTRWARRLMKIGSVFGILAALPGLAKLRKYLQREFQNCRERPKPGLISELVAAEQAHDRLNDDELLAMVFLLLLAGHETTVHLIGSGIVALLDHPDQKARLQADWGLATSAVDEVLRFMSPVQFTKPRFASRDLELHGRSIRRGEFVLPLLAAANCDPDHFTDPETFNISRDPNPHMSFGTGIHVCLGLKLARTEAEIAFERTFTRFPNLALACPRSELQWLPRIGLRAPSALPLTPNTGRSGSVAVSS